MKSFMYWKCSVVPRKIRKISSMNLFQNGMAQIKASRMVSSWQPMKRLAYGGAALVSTHTFLVARPAHNSLITSPASPYRQSRFSFSRQSVCPQVLSRAPLSFLSSRTSTSLIPLAYFCLFLCLHMLGYSYLRFHNDTHILLAP